MSPAGLRQNSVNCIPADQLAVSVALVLQLQAFGENISNCEDTVTDSKLFSISFILHRPFFLVFGAFFFLKLACSNFGSK